MKIEYIKGDLFKTELEVIVHGCNAQGVMGSGIAKVVKQKYPEAFKEYRRKYEEGKLKLGSIVSVSYLDKVIVNAITQEFYGRDPNTRYVSYDAIASVFEKLEKNLPPYDIYEVALPMIGAGLGNGNWNIIEKIIEESTSKLKPFVYVVKDKNYD